MSCRAGEIAVLIPEIVRIHWYQYPLHTDYAGHLRRQLLLHGGTRLTVVNVPIHFEDASSTERPDGSAAQSASKLRVKSSGSGGPHR